MIDRRQLSSFLGAAIAALALCLAPTGVGATASAPMHKPHPRKLSKRQKAALRRQLRTTFKRSPQAMLRRGFIKKAQLADLTLPLTLRLNRSGQTAGDDQLGVTWTSETFPWPTGFAELQSDSGAPGGVIPLDGTSSLEAEFGNDTSGYAGPGVLETVSGGKVAFDSGVLSPAIPVSDYATTFDGNVPLCHAPTIQLSNLTFATGRPTQSLLHLFGGTARVTLHVHAGTTTEVVPPTDCSGGFGSATTHLPADADPIIPITFDATFKISPSVTADGKLRLGILTVPVGSTQPTTFARITMCVDTADPCTTKAFPSRLSMLQLSAEVLVGDIYA